MSTARIRSLVLTMLLLLGFTCHQASAAEPTFVVAGYLPDYRVSQWSKELGPVTDLILFGMSAPTDGKFDPAAISEIHIAIVQEVKAKSPCRLLFTVGGWNKSAGFAVLAANPRLRTEFIKGARDFCLEHGLDGIDYDWEHPEGAKQIESFVNLLVETRTEFAKNGLIVTLAQAGWQNLGQRAYQSVDRVYLMAYDHAYPQATFEKAKIDLDRLIKAGCPRHKIALGVPFYGRNQSGEAKTYAQLTKSASYHSELSVIDGFACNSPKLVAEKVRFAQQQGLAGVMIWELAQDTQDANSLLNSISRTLER